MTRDCVSSDRSDVDVDHVIVRIAINKSSIDKNARVATVIPQQQPPNVIHDSLFFIPISLNALAIGRWWVEKIVQWCIVEIVQMFSWRVGD